MKDFMLLIHQAGDPVKSLSPQQQQQHIQKVGAYIENLIKEGIMKEGQPLEMDGCMVSGKNGTFHDGPFNESKEVIAGYYHIIAKSLSHAVEIAKADPRFEDGEWKIEVRPIMKVKGINK